MLNLDGDRLAAPTKDLTHQRCNLSGGGKTPVETLNRDAGAACQHVIEVQGTFGSCGIHRLDLQVRVRTSERLAKLFTLGNQRQYLMDHAAVAAKKMLN